MIKNSEIAVLVLSTKNDSYQCFKDAIAQSWMNDFSDAGVRVFFYEGDSNEDKIVGDTIYVSCSDDIYHVSQKLIGALNILLSSLPDIKLVYRTNLSSYLELSNFLRFVHRFRLDEQTYTGLAAHTRMMAEKFYQQRPLYYLFSRLPLGRKIRFASGSGFFMGRQICERLLGSNPDLSLIDDVMVAAAVGFLRDQASIPVRLDIFPTVSKFMAISEYDRLVNESLLFHYRFKSKDRFLDSNLLKQFGSADFRRDFLIAS